MKNLDFPPEAMSSASKNRDARRRLKHAVALTLIALIGYMGVIGYRIVRWQMYIWLPDYLASAGTPDTVHQKHLIFVMVDHYEPGRGAIGLERHNQWIGQYRPISDRHFDSKGTQFRYTWFYAYDHENEGVLLNLSQMAYRGYGEVELHWHHAPSNSVEFPERLRQAVAWFQRYGALVSAGPKRETHFAFIHGNWALDNSQSRCGVNRELDILFENGCYADFTFPTIGTVSQPRKVNAIYYARDTDAPKSYDGGVDVEVGSPINDLLMIFQGPCAMNWLTGKPEYSAVESYEIPSRRRVERWIDAGIHVRGRPEWVFVKVYSHGIQSRGAIVGKHLDTMLTDLESICQEREIELHYMTAREAFNVVKAAEDGKSGDPHRFRDYRIPKPYNMCYEVEGPVTPTQHVARASD